MSHAAAKRSIDRRLTGTIVLTTALALVVACTVFIAYDARTGKADLVQRAEMLARVIGVNSAVALTFMDPEPARETLAGLIAADEVLAAAIYDREGRVFATWAGGADGDAGFEAPALGDVGHRFQDLRVHLTQEIAFQGESVGSIYLRLDASSLRRRAQTYVAIVALLLLASAGWAWIFSARLRRQITQPLAALADGSRAISEGDLSRDVAVVDDDEIGTLARTFNAMTAGLRGVVAQVGQSIGEVSAVSRALEERGGQLAQEAQRQSVATGEAAESVGQLSGSIREVNHNVEQLAEAAQETSSSIMEMDASIGEIAAHMDHLNGAIDATSSAVTQVTTHIGKVVTGVETLDAATGGMASRVQELNLSVSQVDSNAAETHVLSEDSSREARDGMRAVNETIGAMGEISSSFAELEQRVGRLSERSQSIDEIVQVIKDVAEQTGLLSLNAAIIAAQAGDHGKAFSVVADQVNALADRTHRSAREIAELITAVQDDTAGAVSAVADGSARVASGVERSREAGKVLEKIMTKTHRSTERVREIAQATARQALDLDGVELAVEGLQEIVARITESTDGQHTATTEIARAIENIRTLGSAVRQSTEEQRRGSRLITKAAADVTSMIDQIARATSAQTRSSETIQQALEVFAGVTEETTRSAQAINDGVSTLSERTTRLENEIGRFKTTRS